MKKMWKNMKEQPDKWIFRILLIAFLSSMVPIWYLSRYIVPGCDDYTYGVRTHAAWIATHSVREVLKAAAATTAEYWHQWQGTYSSIFLMTLSPGIGNEKWYFLTTFIMTGMLGLSVFALVYVVLKKYVCEAGHTMGDTDSTVRSERNMKNATIVAYGTDTGSTGQNDGKGAQTARKKGRQPSGAQWDGSGYQTGICVIVLLFLSFQTMVAPADGLYWYNGALHYVFMESVLFFQTAALLSCRKAQTKGARTGWLLLTCVLAFILGGANLLSGLQSCILTAMLLLYSLLMIGLSKKQADNGGLWRRVCSRAKDTCEMEKKQLWVILPLAVNLIGFCFNVLAPGNTIRETTAEGMGAVKAIILSFYWAAVFVTEWVTPIVLAGFVLLCPVIWKLVKKSKAGFFHPAAAVFFSYCVFAAMFTPTLFATSSEGPDRCKNVMRVVLYLLVFFNLVNSFGYFAGKKEESLIVRLAKETDKNYLLWLVCGVFWMGAIFVLPANKNAYTSISAVRSIVNGEAAQYYAENAERLALYNDESVQDVTITYLNAKPYLLFKADVGNEGSQDYWINISIVDYYKKNSLTIVEAKE